MRRSPDATFYHPVQPDYPTLVVEVSYSQQQQDLPLLAESYIIDSSHAIRAVVGFKIPYLAPGTPHRQKGKASAGADKNANYSPWRPALEYTGAESDDGTQDTIGVCSQVEKEQRFRGSGDSKVHIELDLQLSDLLPSTLSVIVTMRASKQAMPICVPLHELVELLDEAEEAERTPKEPRTEIAAVSTTSGAPTKFRKRKRTPSEELSDGREETFLWQEIREREKDVAVDGEYVERTRRVRRRRSKQGEAGAGDGDEVSLRGGDNAVAGASRDAGWRIYWNIAFLFTSTLALLANLTAWPEVDRTPGNIHLHQPGLAFTLAKSNCGKMHKSTPRTWPSAVTLTGNSGWTSKDASSQWWHGHLSTAALNSANEVLGTKHASPLLPLHSPHALRTQVLRKRLDHTSLFAYVCRSIFSIALGVGRQQRNLRQRLQRFPVQCCEIWIAGDVHQDVKLCQQGFHHMPHSSLACNCQSPNIQSAHPYELGTKCESLEYVRSSANTRIECHHNPISHGIYNLLKSV